MGANLTRFVSETRALGAYPVLITSLSRRTFVNDTDVISDTLGPWAEGQSISSLPPCRSSRLLMWMCSIIGGCAETTRVAADTSTPLVPLLAASMAYQERIGRIATWILNRSPTDFTHLNLSGQHLYGSV